MHGHMNVKYRAKYTHVASCCNIKNAGIFLDNLVIIFVSFT
jgi:hypothetical protein